MDDVKTFQGKTFKQWADELGLNLTTIYKRYARWQKGEIAEEDVLDVVPRGHLGDLLETPEYGAWKNARHRCFFPQNTYYARYGGRGITMCARWADRRYGFERFLADMGKRPGDGKSLDRIDNDGHYSCGHCGECKDNGWPANCRWTTRQVQNSNKTRGRLYMHNGLTLHQLAERIGIGYDAMKIRHRKYRQGFINEAELLEPPAVGRVRGRVKSTVQNDMEDCPGNQTGRFVGASLSGQPLGAGHDE